MPFSRSRSPESMTRSTRAARSPNAPEARSMASTSVVLPWSTCATMATLRRRGRAPRVAGDGSAGAARVEVLTSQGSPSRGPSIPGGHDPRAVAVPIRPLTGPDDPRRRGSGWPKSPALPCARQPLPSAHPAAAPTATCADSSRRHPATGRAAPHRRAVRARRRRARHRAVSGRPPHGRGVSGRPRRGRDGQRRGRTTAPGVIRPCRGRPRRGPRVGRSRRARRVVGRRGRAR